MVILLVTSGVWNLSNIIELQKTKPNNNTANKHHTHKTKHRSIGIWFYNTHVDYRHTENMEANLFSLV